jgi:hypothetical protein
VYGAAAATSQPAPSDLSVYGAPADTSQSSGYYDDSGQWVDAGAPAVRGNNTASTGATSTEAPNYLTGADIKYIAPTNTADTTDMGVYDENGAYVPPHKDPYANGYIQLGDKNIAAAALHDAGGGFSTPYYEARTNTGDLAAAVMAGDGQGVRLVDSKGNIIYSGTGADGARDVTSLANYISQTDGKGAAWNIQIEDPNNKGTYNSAGYESVDKVKKPGALTTILEIAAPIILGAMFPPLAALGTAFTGATGLAGTMLNAGILNVISGTGAKLIEGKSFGDALTSGLKQGVLTGLTAGVVKGLPTNVQNIINTPGNIITKGVHAVENAVPGLSNTMGTINEGLWKGIDAVGGVTQPIFSAAGTGLKAISGVEKAVLGPLGQLTHAVTDPIHNLVSGPPASVTPGTPSGTVSNILVSPNATIPSFAITGSNLLNSSNFGKTPLTNLSQVDKTGDATATSDAKTVDEAVVTGTGTGNNTGAVTGGGGGDATPVSEVVLNSKPVNKTPGAVVAATPPGGDATPVSEVVLNSKLLSKTPGVVVTPTGGGVDPTPLDKVVLNSKPIDKPPPVTSVDPPVKPPVTPVDPKIPGIVTSSTPGTNLGGTKTAAQLRSELGSVFSSKLPPPSGAAANLGALTPSVADWNRYSIDNPEQRFFNYTGQTPASVGNVVPTPAIASSSSMPPMGTPEFSRWLSSQPPALQEYLMRYLAGSKKKFATGGHVSDMAVKPQARQDFAVQGSGTGRSDSIAAKLSDGEYVVDAETVALLGDGSSKAGAKKLDQLRVNIRKQKGRALAKGKFSPNAKAPHAYLSGGRI